jgi:hypothetical protein
MGIETTVGLLISFTPGFSQVVKATEAGNRLNGFQVDTATDHLAKASCEQERTLKFVSG